MNKEKYRASATHASRMSRTYAIAPHPKYTAKGVYAVFVLWAYHHSGKYIYIMGKVVFI